MFGLIFKKNPEIISTVSYGAEKIFLMLITLIDRLQVLSHSTLTCMLTRHVISKRMCCFAILTPLV